VNSHNFSAEELAGVLAYRNGPVVIIGRDIAGLPEPDMRIAAGSPGQELYCGVWNLDADSVEEFEVWRAVNSGRREPVAALDRDSLVEPFLFTHPLPMQKAPLDFISACAQLTAIASGPVRLLNGDQFTNLQCSQLQNGKLRLILRNKRLSYSVAVIDAGAPVGAIEIKTAFPCTRIEADGSRFEVKIPGRGVTVVELELASPWPELSAAEGQPDTVADGNADSPYAAVELHALAAR
jgi:hypothetical protein